MRTGNLRLAAIGTVVTAAEEKEEEGEGPGAHQGAGPGVERGGDQNLIPDRIEVTKGDHLGRARITLKEEKRRDLGGKEKLRMKGHQHLPQQIQQVKQTKTQGVKMHYNPRQ